MNDENPELWGDEPDREPPDGTTWDGPWRRAKRYYPADDTADDDAGELIWARDALEHDGHEDCCHHTRFVTAPVGAGEQTT